VTAADVEQPAVLDWCGIHAEEPGHCSEAAGVCLRQQQAGVIDQIIGVCRRGGHERALMEEMQRNWQREGRTETLDTMLAVSNNGVEWTLYSICGGRGQAACHCTIGQSKSAGRGCISSG